MALHEITIIQKTIGTRFITLCPKHYELNTRFFVCRSRFVVLIAINCTYSLHNKKFDIRGVDLNVHNNYNLHATEIAL